MVMVSHLPSHRFIEKEQYILVDLLVLALRIFCPLWNHNDGNDLREMIKYYQHTKEILRELEPEKTAAVTFESITKNPRMKERVGNGTTRGNTQDNTKTMFIYIY